MAEKTRLEHYTEQLAEQRRWIEQHGGTLENYRERYISDGQDPDIIWRADQHALIRCEEIVKAYGGNPDNTGPVTFALEFMTRIGEKDFINYAFIEGVNRNDCWSEATELMKQFWGEGEHEGIELPAGQGPATPTYSFEDGVILVYPHKWDECSEENWKKRQLRSHMKTTTARQIEIEKG